MGVLRERILTPLRLFIKRSFSGMRPRTARPRHRLYSRKQHLLSPEKQAELDRLCEQLLKKQELITSGKLQFIGLTRIKKRLGKRWKGLSRIVYETAESVISGYLDDKYDFYVRYKDEVYFLLFLSSTTTEGQEKATAIAEEIRRRLFELNEKELRNIEIRESVGVLNKAYLQDCDLYEFLEAYSREEFVYPPLPAKTKPDKAKRAAPQKIPYVQVSAKDCRPSFPTGNTLPPSHAELYYSYLPLWDVKRGALTTYLCLARSSKKYNNIFEAHKALYVDTSFEEQVALDIRTLEFVIRGLKDIQRKNKRFLLACPVQYETLHHFESYGLYKQVLQKIPEVQRGFLILYVMDMKQKLPHEDTYWFIKPVKEFCRHCFAELPLGQDINFNYMRNLGVDAVGFRIGDADISRAEVLKMVSRFSFRAKGLHIPMTFIFELSTISLATSAIFTEYDYVGGEAIHPEVAKPDRMLRFRSEDLLMRLIKEKSA